MLLAGYETSANLLAFAVHSLAKHPDKAAELQAELDGVKGAQRAVQTSYCTTADSTA